MKNSIPLNDDKQIFIHNKKYETSNLPLRGIVDGYQIQKIRIDRVYNKKMV